jgi:hypothetical protein
MTSPEENKELHARAHTGGEREREREREREGDRVAKRKV